MRAVSVLLIGALGASPALAQDTAPEEERPPIIVTGGPLDDPDARSTYANAELAPEVTVLPASGRIEDALAAVAGFQQFRRSDSRSANPSAQGATMRGLGGNATSRTLVLLDGVPLADPFFGHVPFSALPFERLERATVARGGGSGAFAAGAVAGTVNLYSAGPDRIGPISGSALLNDRGESEVSAVAAPRLGSGFAVIGGRWDRGKGFWTTPLAQRGPASVRARFESWSAGMRAVAPLTDEIEIQARALLFDDRRTLRFAGADSSSSGGDASLRLAGRGDWQFEALGYVQARDFSNVVVSSTTFRRTLDQRKTPSLGLGGKIELRSPASGAHEFRFGIDWRRASGEMHEEAYSAATGALTARRVAGGVNSDLGLFAEHDWRLGPALLVMSLRGDRWSLAGGRFREINAAGATVSNLAFPDRSGWRASYRGAVLVEAGGGLSLRAAAYSGLRQPTLNELYRPFVVFPVTTRANADLSNERLEGYEAGFDFEPSSQLHIQFTAFENRIRDAIANVTIGPNLRERRNVGAVRSRGIELASRIHVGEVYFDGSLSWIDAKIETGGLSAALDGKRPAQVPEFAASATLAWRPGENWLVALTLRHTGAQFEDDLENDILPAATTLDAVVAVPLANGFSLVLRGENLTGTEIVTRNQAGSIDLGIPRTIWAGVRYGF